jgi:hypothetical protein
MPDTALHSETTQDILDPLVKETGIAAQNMYRMSGLCMRDFGSLGLSTDAHRLLHALLHVTCRALPEWSPYVLQPSEGYQARSVVLRSQVGLRARNCNLNLHTGIERLALVEIFDRLEFTHGNEFIRWRFKNNVLSAILDQQSYGLLDVSVLPSLKNGTDYQIYCLSSLVRRMRKPEFSFWVAEAAIWAGHGIAEWSSVRSIMQKAISRSCKRYGFTAFLLLERQGNLRGIDAVTVRFWRPGCCWKAAALAYTPGPTVKCMAIDGSHAVTAEPAAFPALVEQLRGTRWRVGGVPNAVILN